MDDGNDNDPLAAEIKRRIGLLIDDQELSDSAKVAIAARVISIVDRYQNSSAANVVEASDE